MLTVKEAVKKLKQANIINNEEVFRRWLRKGKVKGAVIHSKREGWLIPKESIDEIITTNKEKSSISEYKKGYNAGYSKAIDESRSRMRKWIGFGYEKSGTIKRSEFKQISPLRSDKLLNYIDQHYFARGVAKPRPNTDYYFTEGFFCYPIGNIVIDTHEVPYSEIYEEEQEQHIDTLAILMLAEYLRLRYIEDSKKS
ncbi:hypothetical protein [Enterococcus cecorum]|uniref:hypothetical protein n=1 Tax=Enterococcus cecorum TaxID=44008 RepID=UPI002ACA91A7|nr:hypothetical protein [Enterococcus cecorum]MDZ5560753.1 hypothetical protein [Enterococcus cecorum]